MTRDATDDAPDDAFSELAQLILDVSRLVRARTPSGAEVVPLTDTERTVMRLVDLHPGSAPSELARRARLQRTNVSTALRALEGKGMLTRTPAPGRGVVVHPSERAASNLAVLRAAWGRELAGVLGDRPAAVRRCNDLLRQLEERLTTDEPSGSLTASDPGPDPVG
ncbi:MAG: MarR family transcriptional regulator [Jatrophihabitantaceae bacterium]